MKYAFPGPQWLRTLLFLFCEPPLKYAAGWVGSKCSECSKRSFGSHFRTSRHHKSRDPGIAGPLAVDVASAICREIYIGPIYQPQLKRFIAGTRAEIV